MSPSCSISTAILTAAAAVLSFAETGPGDFAHTSDFAGHALPLLVASAVAFFVLNSLLIGSAVALAQDVGIITGSEKGTYYRFGLDLQKLLKPNGFNVTVHPSRGSVDNIYAVYQRPGVQIGIVQADVLAFITRIQSNPLLAQIAKKTRLVFPLYNEEIHLVGKRGIRDFDDLAGKRVAIGRDGSGTYLTSRILFKLSEVQAEFVLIDTAGIRRRGKVASGAAAERYATA